MVENNEFKTIPVSPKTHERLTKMGNKSQTYDDLVNSLIDFWVMYKGVVENNK